MFLRGKAKLVVWLDKAHPLSNPNLHAPQPLLFRRSKDTQEEGEEADAQPRIESEQVNCFLVIFDRTFRALRPQEEPVKPDEADLTRLHSYFERGYGNALEKWLPAFFACSFGFVTRRNYSLHAYLHCFFTLQAQSGAVNIKTM